MAKTPDGLKACPFCGGEAELLHKYRADLEGKVIVRARCKQCYAQSPYKSNPQLHGWFDAKDKGKALAAWNRRVAE